MRRPTSPCPCCGHHTLTGRGDYDLCPVCFWEDDPDQLRWPDSADGVNGKSLIESQQTYLRLGAMDEVFVSKVRPARSSEPIDDGWRPVDPDIDSFEPTGVELGTAAEFYTGPYWWRSTFWRRGASR